jgi:phosphoribosylformylglycinamidine cyclo-ligase
MTESAKTHNIGSSAYKDAGVDTDKAAALVDRIKPFTAKTKRSGVMSGIGGFGALFDPKAAGFNDPILVSATDGVGTKIKIAIEIGRHDTIGIDAVAMCVNDIIVQGAEPLYFLDYFATGKLNNDIAEDVIRGIAEGCQQAGCALIGGETAEMPGLYAAGDYDIAGFSVGAAERGTLITGDTIKDGDVILGLASNGLHSNGFSLVRRLIESTQGFVYDSPAAFDPSLSLGELLLLPTRIYVKSLLAALDIKADDGAPAIKGMAHITGGGFLENIPRVLPDGLGVRIDAKSWDLPPLFSWLGGIGKLSTHDLSATLNCGIGMAVICDEAHSEALTRKLQEQGETVYQIGRIVDEASQDKRVVIDHIDECWTF